MTVWGRINHLSCMYFYAGGGWPILYALSTTALAMLIFLFHNWFITRIQVGLSFFLSSPFFLFFLPFFLLIFCRQIIAIRIIWDQSKFLVIWPMGFFGILFNSFVIVQLDRWETGSLTVPFDGTIMYFLFPVPFDSSYRFFCFSSEAHNLSICAYLGGRAAISEKCKRMSEWQQCW